MQDNDFSQKIKLKSNKLYKVKQKSNHLWKITVYWIYMTKISEHSFLNFFFSPDETLDTLKLE